jgi:hypothetical protein
MKQLMVAIVLSILFISAKSSAQIDTLCQGGSTTVMNGEYNVMNNVWGSGIGVGDQCIAVDMDSSYFKVTLSTHNSSGVASYPTIFKGCHWNWCTTLNNPMPVTVKEIGSTPFTWTVNTKDANGTWNAALDIWFASQSTGFDYDAEMMIWIDYNGGAGPAGSRIGTVNIGGLSWDLYFVAWDSWNYIAYKITTPVDSVSLDLRDFINDSAIRGYLMTPWYLHAVEAGFEIWRDGQGLTSNYFSTDVIETTSPLNFAPVAFSLQGPPNNTQLDSNIVLLRWQNSIDPDLDAVEYLIQISSSEGDTTVTGLDTNAVFFNGSGFFKNNTTYTWYVEATDGSDTTRSTNQRTFFSPVEVGVNDIKPLPDEFVLYQNYPNPFNPETKIQYNLENSGKVYLSIYDLLGREVAVLVNEVQNAGFHEISFSETELPSGIYYYRLIAGSEVSTKKMALLR